MNIDKGVLILLFGISGGGCSFFSLLRLWCENFKFVFVKEC